MTLLSLSLLAGDMGGRIRRPSASAIRAQEAAIQDAVERELRALAAGPGAAAEPCDVFLEHLDAGADTLAVLLRVTNPMVSGTREVVHRYLSHASKEWLWICREVREL